MQRILAIITDITTRRPKLVLVFCTLLTVAAVITIPRLQIVTSRDAMMPKDNPYRKALDDFLKTFGGMGDLIVVAEGTDPDGLAAFADDVAARLKKLPEVAEVFYKVPVDFFKDKAFLYVPLDQLRMLADQIEKHQKEIQKIASIRSLPGLLNAMNEAMAKSMSSKETGPKGAEQLIALLTEFFREMDSWLKGNEEPIRVMERLYSRLSKEVGMGVDPRGYLRSRDKGLIFIFTRSALGDELGDIEKFVEAVKKEVDAAKSGKPGLKDAGLTGFPAHTYEEMTTILSDLWRITILSFVGIVLLFAVTFKSVKKTLLASVPLISGSAWGLSLTWLIFGHVNLISSAFFAILIGMGIDFSIHFMSRFDEERVKGADDLEAVRKTMMGSGRGIVTSALTSTTAFFAIGFVEFKAFAELGVVAGFGLLAVLVATLLELPSALTIIKTKVPASPRGLGGSILPWLAMFVTRRRWPVLVTSILLTALAGWGLKDIPFDYDYMHILPKNSESAMYQAKMVNRSDFSAEFAAFVADSLADATRITNALRKKPSVAKVESIDDLIPSSQKAKLAILKKLKPIFHDMNTRYSSLKPVSSKALEKSLSALEDQLEHAQEMALAAGRKGLVASLDKLVNTVDDTLDAAGQKDAADRATRFQEKLFSQLAVQLKLFKENLDRKKEVTVSQIPNSIRKRFASGKSFAVYAFPSKSIWDKAFLDQFVKDARSVDKHATGFAVRHWAFSEMIQRGFEFAALGAGIAILLMLILDFWSIRKALFAVLPLAFGVTWMLGLMRLFGINYNFANLPGVPLIIGIGVASGVHLVHRFSQSGETDVAGSVVGTGRAIALSAWTTMLAFGTLGLSRHRGVASFGWVLLIGVGSCLIASLVVLPAFLEISRRRRSKV
ncbi:MAG: MMPL family transporter [Deltaproteobacteria bacterium]|nr:MMPL family transporter [Deltaproteobacteria bacterium]